MPFLDDKQVVVEALNIARDWTEVSFPANIIPYYASALIVEYSAVISGKASFRDGSILLIRGTPNGHIYHPIRISHENVGANRKVGGVCFIPIGYIQDETGAKLVKFDYKVPKAFEGGITLNVIGYAQACLEVQ